ncbi:MAG: hypothetical protein ACM3U1_08820 [Chloroflexota bacterium]
MHTTMTVPGSRSHSKGKKYLSWFLWFLAFIIADAALFVYEKHAIDSGIYQSGGYESLIEDAAILLSIFFFAVATTVSYSQFYAFSKFKKWGLALLVSIVGLFIYWVVAYAVNWFILDPIF